MTWNAVDVDVDTEVLEGGFWSFTGQEAHPWAWHDDVFTPDECDAIIALGNRHKLSAGETGRGVSEYRQSDIRFLHPNRLTNWVFGRLAAVAMNLNDQFFGFDLTGFGEGIQFTRYTAPGQHYDSHTDMTFQMAVRKLSLVVQLSDPYTYEGGTLEISPSGEPLEMERKQGRVVAFPSWTVHRVLPITEGTRYSLVAWITGPAFR